MTGWPRSSWPAPGREPATARSPGPGPSPVMLESAPVLPPREPMADIDADPPAAVPPSGPVDRTLWGVPTPGESRWPAALAVSAALVIQAALPGRLTVGPWWIVPGLELCLLVPLMIASPR